MSMEQLLETIRDLDDVVELAPTEGTDFPEIAWGDHFFYVSVDGQIPPGQPFATVVTKNYPDDIASDLDPAGRWRLNLHVGRTRYVELIGTDPQQAPAVDLSEADVILPHPTYHALGWIGVVNPGDATAEELAGLVRDAHRQARERVLRRSS